ncbi:hypothetical protein F2P81_011315 [Scophthalmus maximus]|uniref:Ig-like V-type domain-containing protein FAM187A n=1 Tax=Scophthalmus maximus TaxID=52904 RepID=A0A6A4SPT7_SCOMX|nr:hypothetical protein F2P81_011315 [Scophthalmus maximus]
MSSTSSTRPPPLVLVLFLLLCRELWGFEAPEDKQDVFARKACPAFLTFTNAAHLAGVTVELPCHCKPQQVQSVVWFFRKRLGSAEETRALTDHHGNTLLDTSRVPHSGDLRSRFSIRLFSLLVFRAGLDDSGIYICGSARKDFFYAYDLDIQEARRLSFAPRLAPETTNRKLNEGNGLGSAQPLYRVFTSFRPWSVCDRCGVPGEQVRAGLCYVHSQFLHVRYRRANVTVASCGSGAVPRAFGGLKQSRVGAKLEVKSCQSIHNSECVRPTSSIYVSCQFRQSVPRFLRRGYLRAAALHRQIDEQLPFCEVIEVKPSSTLIHWITSSVLRQSYKLAEIMKDGGLQRTVID